MSNLAKQVADLFGVSIKIPDENWKKIDAYTKKLLISDILYAAGFIKEPYHEEGVNK